MCVRFILLRSNKNVSSRQPGPISYGTFALLVLCTACKMQFRFLRKCVFANILLGVGRMPCSPFSCAIKGIPIIGGMLFTLDDFPALSAPMWNSPNTNPPYCGAPTVAAAPVRAPPKGVSLDSPIVAGLRGALAVE